MPDTSFELLNRYINVSRETFDRLSVYCELLLKWQSKINLISNDTIGNIWQRHILDSLQVVKYIPPNFRNIIDIGSGAGFPGMALAIYGIRNIHLIESDGKKTSFLKEAARITKTEITVYNDRAENAVIDNCDIILSRATSNLNQLLNLAYKNVSRETICLFHKGKNYSNELEEAKKYWSFDQEIFPSISDSGGVILKLSHIKRHEK